MMDEYIKKVLIDKWATNWNDEMEISFKHLFLTVYEKTKEKKEKSKKNNFLAKQFFIFFILIGIIAMGSLLIISIKEEWEISDCIWGESIILLITVLISGLISKWIDIMKYQETWARHSLHIYKMETEVVKYVYGIEPYNGAERNKLFIKNILDVWDANQLTFYDNLQKNEKVLMDYFNNIKQFK